MNIITATSNHLDRLKEIVSLQGHYPEPHYFERIMQEQQSGSRNVFIIEKEQSFIGYGILNYTPRYMLFKKLGIPEIQDLNVIPRFRRQGAGQALLSYCEEIARSKHYDHIGIAVGLNKSFGPAQRLYVKNGYVPDGYGVTYDRSFIEDDEYYPVDGDLCLMLIKDLNF